MRLVLLIGLLTFAVEVHGIAYQWLPLWWSMAFNAVWAVCFAFAGNSGMRRLYDRRR